MHPDDTGPEEGLGIEDRSVDVGLGGHVDHGVRAGDERFHDVRVGDVALDEREPPGLAGVRFDRGEVGAIAGVGQLVEDRDARAVVASEDPAHELAADEPRAAGDQEVGIRPDAILRGCRALAHFASFGCAGGAGRRPAWSSASAISAARSRLVTVPASAQWPSYTSVNRPPSGM